MINVVVGQEVACFSYSHRNEGGAYTVTSISPKGNKIVAKRNSDGYTRTFDQHGVETGSIGSKWYRSYMRADIDVVKQEKAHRDALNAASAALHNIDQSMPMKPSKEYLQRAIIELRAKLDNAERLVNLIP